MHTPLSRLPAGHHKKWRSSPALCHLSNHAAHTLASAQSPSTVSGPSCNQFFLLQAKQAVPTPCHIHYSHRHMQRPRHTGLRGCSPMRPCAHALKHSIKARFSHLHEGFPRPVGHVRGKGAHSGRGVLGVTGASSRVSGGGGGVGVRGGAREGKSKRLEAGH